jgi:transposase
MVSGTYEQRRTYAIRWHYLDNLSNKEIRQRFRDMGIGDLSRETVSKYVNSEPGEEVLERIRDEHAETRLQIADRNERLYHEARQDKEQLARTEEAITAMRPETEFNDSDVPWTVRDWEVLDESADDHPDWADPDLDVAIRFTDDTRTVQPGQEFYVADPAGEPTYESVVVGVERDVPDRVARSYAREEQSEYMTAKGEALGVYEHEQHINVDADVDTEVEVDEATAEAIRNAQLGEGNH